MKCNLKSKILAFLASGAVALNLFNSPVFAVKTYLHTLLEDTSKLVTVDDVRKILDEYPAWIDEIDDKNQSPLYIATHRKMDTVRDFLISRGASRNVALENAIDYRDDKSVHFLCVGANIDETLYYHYVGCLNKQVDFDLNDLHIFDDLVSNDLPLKQSYVYSMLCYRLGQLHDSVVWENDYYVISALNRLRAMDGLPPLPHKDAPSSSSSYCIIA